MEPKLAGTLPRHDPLYRFLTEEVFPGTSGQGEFTVYYLNGEDGAVFLYVNPDVKGRIVGKFYGRKPIPDATDALRSLLLQREFDNLALLRNGAFDKGPFIVPRPLATRDDIDWLLLEDYADGVTLHHVVWQKLRGGGTLLDQTLDVIAELLARLHRIVPPARVLPARPLAQYYDKLLAQLQQDGVLSAFDVERLRSLDLRWHASGRNLGDRTALIHGDATPEHFVYDAYVQRMTLIDLETLRHGDPAEDIGYLAGEMKHLFWSYTGDPATSEPHVEHFYHAYARAAGVSGAAFVDLMERARYFMGCAELRIARNAWLSLDYRKSLAAEAERCLKL